MIGSRLFRKHFAIAAGSVLGFLALGSFGCVVLIENISAKPAFQPPLFFARLVEELGRGDAVAGVKKITELHSLDKRPYELLLLDERGEPLYSPPGEIRFALRPEQLPSHVHEGRLVKRDDLPPVDPPFFPGRQMPIANGLTSVMRLDSDPARYLVFRPHHLSQGPPLRFFPLVFLTFVITALVGVAFALFLIFRSLRDHVTEADQVINELQRGNLKARFPVRKDDEIGQAMRRFNLMADEIERLMEQLRSVERSRTFLLQELAHDLRTPVASLSNLLETVFSQLRMDETVAELAGLAQKETDYIARMVEDLLLLAQVSEPSYRTQEGAVDLDNLIEEEGEALELRFQGRVRFIKAEGEALPEGDALVAGDAHLLRRLFRNTLENAFSFAKSAVHMQRRVENDTLVIDVWDDGPGFSAEMLATFGERRNRRKIEASRAGRLSLGLGSVIMKTVAHLHRGEVRVSNRPEGGAAIEIHLPLARGREDGLA